MDLLILDILTAKWEIAYGSRPPVLSRPDNEANMYKFLGFCFVNGIMNHELRTLTPDLVVSGRGLCCGEASSVRQPKCLNLAHEFSAHPHQSFGLCNYVRDWTRSWGYEVRARPTSASLETTSHRPRLWSAYGCERCPSAFLSSQSMSLCRLRRPEGTVPGVEGRRVLCVMEGAHGALVAPERRIRVALQGIFNALSCHAHAGSTIGDQSPHMVDLTQCQSLTSRE